MYMRELAMLQTRSFYACGRCGAARAERVCGGCLLVRYCTIACARMSWDKGHAHRCSRAASLRVRLCPRRARIGVRLDEMPFDMLTYIMRFLGTEDIVALFSVGPESLRGAALAMPTSMRSLLNRLYRLTLVDAPLVGVPALIADMRAATRHAVLADSNLIYNNPEGQQAYKWYHRALTERCSVFPGAEGVCARFAEQPSVGVDETAGAFLVAWPLDTIRVRDYPPSEEDVASIAAADAAVAALIPPELHVLRVVWFDSYVLGVKTRARGGAAAAAAAATAPAGWWTVPLHLLYAIAAAHLPEVRSPLDDSLWRQWLAEDREAGRAVLPPPPPAPLVPPDGVTTEALTRARVVPGVKGAALALHDGRRVNVWYERGDGVHTGVRAAVPPPDDYASSTTVTYAALSSISDGGIVKYPGLLVPPYTVRAALTPHRPRFGVDETMGAMSRWVRATGYTAGSALADDVPVETVWRVDYDFGLLLLEHSDGRTSIVQVDKGTDEHPVRATALATPPVDFHQGTLPYPVADYTLEGVLGEDDEGKLLAVYVYRDAAEGALRDVRLSEVGVEIDHDPPVTASLWNRRGWTLAEVIERERLEGGSTTTVSAEAGRVLPIRIALVGNPKRNKEGVLVFWYPQ